MNELAIRILNPEDGQFLRRIEWNAEEFEGWMHELSAQYADTALITPDDFKAAKKDRAELNKLLKAIGERRVEVKKAIMEPYDKFEKELEIATAAVTQVAQKIDQSIKEYETAEKEQKKARIRKIFDNEVQHPFYEQIPPEEMAFLEFERVFEPKWLNASAKITQVEKELNEKLNKVEEGIRAILDMDTDPALRASTMQEFRRTLDLGAALRLHGDLAAKAQREKEEQRRKEEEQRRREAEAAERKRQQDMQALRERLGEQQKAPAPPEQPDRPEAPVSRFSQQGQGNPRAMPQSPTQGQADGKFGPSGVMDNGNRYAESVYRKPEILPGPPRQPVQPPKMMFTEFRVEGTREQLLALKDYMDRNGLRYGPVKKG